MKSESADCGRAAALLPEFWQDGLAGRASDGLWLRQHLEACSDCAGVDAAWRELGELPSVEPGPPLRARFERMLAVYQHGLQPGTEPRIAPRPAWRPAWRPAALLLVGLLAFFAGGAGGWWLHRAPAPAAPDSTAAQIAELRQEVQATRQLAVLSLLQQQSASDRLQGVVDSGGLVASDPAVETALVGALKYDPSPDVRLAALDALAHRASPPTARQALVEAFPYQSSPLVQIALVDSLTPLRDAQSLAFLHQVSRDAALLPDVRQQAALALAHR